MTHALACVPAVPALAATIPARKHLLAAAPLLVLLATVAAGVDDQGARGAGPRVAQQAAGVGAAAWQLPAAKLPTCVWGEPPVGAYAAMQWVKTLRLHT